MTHPKPQARPARPFFSSGPCVKPPAWSPQRLSRGWLGRNHRAPGGKERLRTAIDRTRALLELPDDYLLAITPASDTGAVELAMWSLLGPRPVQLLSFEVFGRTWVRDGRELKLEVEALEAPFGRLPDLSRVRPDHDLVFPWNGTTSGVRVPDAGFISAEREGVTICDATSAVFAQRLDWSKLDAVTFSWQKALGGEAGHGMLALSPRAVERIEGYDPPWPLPKLFRLKSEGRLDRTIFEGATINTPSMLCVEDWLACLDWAEGCGGPAALRARADRNFVALARWVERTAWVDFLAEEPATRSNTSACLKIIEPNFTALPEDRQRQFVSGMARRLEAEGAAFDVEAHRSAPPGLRIWCGPTVDAEDVEALGPWLAWAYAHARAG
ncbi:MAG TPA: phosphoserine transaminase [Caulobacteraceae bacterium]|jgi:phosphoserine aminotransferase